MLFRSEPQKLLVHRLDAWREAFEQEVRIPRQPPALLDARLRLNGSFERLDRGCRLLLELNRHERDHRKAEMPFVERGADRADHAALTQGSHAALTGRRRDADAAGQLIVADAPVLLQFGQYLQVDAIELFGICHLVGPPLASHEVSRGLAFAPGGARRGGGGDANT